MRIYKQNIVFRVRLLSFGNSLYGQGDIVAVGRLKERFIQSSPPASLQCLKGGTWAECTLESIKVYLLWKRNVLRRTNCATMVTQVPTHEDKCVGSSAGKACQMPDSVARRIKQIERAVAEEVESTEVADFKSILRLFE